MSTSSPRSARFAANGDPFTTVICLDFNSMYLWSQKKNQPLTPGLRWVKNDNGIYTKQYLSTGGSFKALQYLYYSQSLLDRAGYNITIEHQYHQGEKKVYGYKVDGYVRMGSKEIVFEFNGNFIISLLRSLMLTSLMLTSSMLTYLNVYIFLMLTYFVNIFDMTFQIYFEVVISMDALVLKNVQLNKLKKMKNGKKRDKY